jgi:hypothetical protein
MGKWWFMVVAVAPLALAGCGGGGSEPTKISDEEKTKQIEALKKQNADEWKSTLKKR